MKEPMKRHWAFIAGVSLVPPGLAGLLLAWGMPRSNSPDELEVAALFLGSALTVSALIWWQAFVKVTDKGVAVPFVRPIPWSEIVDVRGYERRIELRSESRHVAIAVWPFRSRHDLVSYIAEQLRRAGRGDLVR